MTTLRQPLYYTHTHTHTHTPSNLESLGDFINSVKLLQLVATDGEDLQIFAPFDPKFGVQTFEGPSEGITVDCGL